MVACVWFSIFFCGSPPMNTNVTDHACYMLGVWQCRWGWLQLTLPLAPWGVVALVVSASPPVAGPVLSLDRSVTCICPLWGCCFDAWMPSTEASAAPKTPQNWRIEPCSLSGSTRTRIPFLPVW